MRLDVVTLFPGLFEATREQGITRRAFAPEGPLQLRLWPLREHADNAYRRVDDRTYGGGPGMVLMAEPLERALLAIRAERGDDGAPVIHFAPSGRRLDQARVRALARSPGAILLCGRYEGIDQRFVDRHVDESISLGDFVLSGGEWPALVLIDAVARLLPGVLTPASHEQDSFEDGLLDHPHYSRPDVWRPQAAGRGPAEWPVPDVLRGGHHAEIETWRRRERLRLTASTRPDLIDAARAAGALSKADEKFLAGLAASG